MSLWVLVVAIMPPRRDFRAERTLKVVSFKGGKTVKKSKLSIPVRYTVSSASAFPSTSDSTTDDVSLISDDHDIPHGFDHGSNKPKQARFKKRRIKRKLKVYHERKATLAASWLNAREQLITALISRQALPISQCCVICNKAATGRCLDCSPGHFLCHHHLKIVHAGGRSLHKPEVWKVRQLSKVRFLFV